MGIIRYMSRLALAGVVLVAIIAGATACRESEPGEQTTQTQAAVTQTQPAGEPTRVDAQQVREWMSEGDELVVLDSRSEGGWGSAATKAKGAIRVPPHDVATHLDRVPRDGRIIVYCT
jgi:hypothetical protein